MMGDLTYEERKRMRRAAEDARDACNRHYGPFVDVVAHPLNILALLDMAARGAESAPRERSGSDECLALDLLARLFSAWEAGIPCYTSPTEGAGFVGNAFRLDDETFKSCSDLLNRRRPGVGFTGSDGGSALRDLNAVGEREDA